MVLPSPVYDAVLTERADYHFPHEEIKIPCLCGHPLCRKYLN